MEAPNFASEEKKPMTNTVLKTRRRHRAPLIRLAENRHGGIWGILGELLLPVGAVLLGHTA